MLVVEAFFPSLFPPGNVVMHHISYGRPAVVVLVFYYLTLAVNRLIFCPLRKLLGFKLAGGSDVRLLLSSNESLSRANQPQIWFGYASISGSHYIIQDLHEKCG
jgi:hypothetical protein